MNKFYSLLATAAPFALLWVWQVNYAPDADIWATTMLYSLFAVHGMIEYADGYRRAYLTGRKVFMEFANDVGEHLATIKKEMEKK